MVSCDCCSTVFFGPQSSRTYLSIASSEWSGSSCIYFSKTEQWVVVSSSFLPATFSSMYTALQSSTKVAQFSLRARGFSVCRSAQLLGARTRRIVEVVWGADWADPDPCAPCWRSAFEKVLSGKKRVGLYFRAHWCPPCRQIDHSNGANTSSARTWGGGRPAT